MPLFRGFQTSFWWCQISSTHRMVSCFFQFGFCLKIGYPWIGGENHFPSFSLSKWVWGHTTFLDTTASFCAWIFLCLFLCLCFFLVCLLFGWLINWLLDCPANDSLLWLLVLFFDRLDEAQHTTRLNHKLLAWYTTPVSNKFTPCCTLFHFASQQWLCSATRLYVRTTTYIFKASCSGSWLPTTVANARAQRSDGSSLTFMMCRYPNQTSSCSSGTCRNHRTGFVVLVPKVNANGCPSACAAIPRKSIVVSNAQKAWWWMLRVICKWFDEDYHNLTWEPLSPKE